jgi:cell division protein FtsB
MSEELTREEIAKIFHQVWLHADEQGEQETRVMAYIAGLRAKVEALGRDFTEAMLYTGQLERTNADLVQERDDLKAQVFKQYDKEEALIEERDRLKEALRMVDSHLDRIAVLSKCPGSIAEARMGMQVISAALRGETGGG